MTGLDEHSSVSCKGRGQHLDKSIVAALQQAVEANWERQVTWLQDLVRFPSRRGHEAACQDFVARSFAARGWRVDRYTLAEVAMTHLPGYSPVMDTDYANHVQVVASLPAPGATGRSLILQGHVDVVPEGPADMWTHPPFDPVITGEWMNGRGAADMKQGVSAMVFALDALHTAGLAPAADVYVQTVTEEECTGNGALSTLARGYRADACLIPEASDGGIFRAEVGVVWFRLRVRGIPVHVATAQTGTNAILSAYVLLTALARHTADLNARADYYGVKDPVKFNPGVIRGGDWGSSTPAWCEVDCRIGVLPGTTIDAARQGVLDTVAQAAEHDPFLRCNPPEVVWNGFAADAYVLEPGSDAERALETAHARVFNTPMHPVHSTALTDTRFYGLYYGIPGLCYGPRGENAHGFNERAHLPTLKRTTIAIATFIAEWCGTRPIGD